MFEKGSQAFAKQPRRYQTSSQQPKIRTQKSAAPTIRLDLMFWGALSSFIVFFLFYNLQAISDLAPESIKNSDSPGAFGMPVALLSVGWFVSIPTLFIRGVYRSAFSGKLVLNWFATGAFIVMSLGFLFINLGS